MIDLSLGRDLETQLEHVRRLGREYLRPLGIEADSRREPVPPDHPFFALAWRMGLGQPLGVEERPAGGPDEECADGGADARAGAPERARILERRRDRRVVEHEA